MPELMVRSEKPTRIWFDALQRTNIILKVNVPAGSVRIFLPFRIGRYRIQIRFFPETLRQRREPEPGVKLLGSFDYPFGFSSFEILVDVRCFDQAWPFLTPTVMIQCAGIFFGTG